MDQDVRSRLLKQIAGWENCAVLVRLRVAEILQNAKISSRTEAEAFFLFHQTLPEDGVSGDDLADAWRREFVRHISAFVLTGEKRDQRVDGKTAAWLVSNLRDAAGALIPIALDVIVAVLSGATASPPALRRLAFLAICQRIEHAGHAQAHLVSMLETVLYIGGADQQEISGDEASRLMGLNSAIARAPNDRSWNKLYARAVGSHLMKQSEVRISPEVLPVPIANTNVAACPKQDEDWLVRQLRRAEAANPAERALVTFVQSRLPDLNGSNAA